MKRTLTVLSVLLSCFSVALADIAPNPIEAKGILANKNSTVKMVSEKVVVDLYKDSSVVECRFYMKNEGAKQRINIGFPEISFDHFYSNSVVSREDSEKQTEKQTAGRIADEVSNRNAPERMDWTRKFHVRENGEEVGLVDFYTPSPEPQKEWQLFDKTGEPDYKDRPWYLWDSEFVEGETKVIPKTM